MNKYDNTNKTMTISLKVTHRWRNINSIQRYLTVTVSWLMDKRGWNCHLTHFFAITKVFVFLTYWRLFLLFSLLFLWWWTACFLLPLVFVIANRATIWWSWYLSYFLRLLFRLCPRTEVALVFVTLYLAWHRDILIWVISLLSRLATIVWCL